MGKVLTKFVDLVLKVDENSETPVGKLKIRISVEAIESADR